MKPFSAPILALALLCGCMSQGEIYTATPQVQFALQENYQAVYARLLRTMKVCINPGATLIPGMATMQVEGQLYPDLGYGEITTSLQGSIPTYYHYVRVARSGSGSQVSIVVENMASFPKEQDKAKLERWARGSTVCG